MFYYMKFRIGVCIPSTCDQSDMDSISSALSSSLRLNITIPDCRVKQTDQQLTRHQLAGGLAFALVSALVLLATLIDCFKLKLRQWERQDIEFIQQGAPTTVQPMMGQCETKSRPADIKIKINQTSRCAPRLCDSASQTTSPLERLGKHWTWMSFSLITNFRLYFQPERALQQGNHRNQCEHATTRPMSFKFNDRRTIACLNGIRVLSLCWVIVANSYLTLDPRATKRLTKTREAPRDFLFQLVVQASLAIETFFFLSGLLMSISFSQRLRPNKSPSQAASQIQTASSANTNSSLRYLLEWVQFYVHRYVRMTPPTMLVIAISMYAYHYGDGPLWFEATQKVHQSCAQNWWRHLLHVVNFIDTRQMCFVHYWYIAADMQLFLFAPIIMFLLFKFNLFGYCLIAIIGGYSIGSVFHTTYTRGLPPTLLFYSTDPESRREFGNTIMTKPMTHALPYLVGMLVGWWCVISDERDDQEEEEQIVRKPLEANSGGIMPASTTARTFEPRLSGNVGIGSYAGEPIKSKGAASLDSSGIFSATGIFGLLALVVALIEVFLPYKWNNSHLPSRLVASIYAALFRLGWALVLAYVVVSCRHRPDRNCCDFKLKRCSICAEQTTTDDNKPHHNHSERTRSESHAGLRYCYCGLGGNSLNQLLSLSVFTHLSKLSFVAYLIHLPLMSVFIGQTRGLFAFSHTLVIHFAISYLVISFVLSFLLVHFIEFPFITFERLLFQRLFSCLSRDKRRLRHETEMKKADHPMPNTLEAVRAHEQHLYYQDPRIRPMVRPSTDDGLHQSTKPTTMTATAGQLHRTTTGGHNYQNNLITTERL